MTSHAEKTLMLRRILSDFNDCFIISSTQAVEYFLLLIQKINQICLLYYIGQHHYSHIVNYFNILKIY
jgi:hypothetical protein